jgi:hypothetical protein
MTCNFAVKLVISGRHAFAIRCRPGSLEKSQAQPGSSLFSETHADRKPRESEADNRHLADILLQKTAKTTTDRRHPWPVVPNRARDMQLSGRLSRREIMACDCGDFRVRFAAADEIRSELATRHPCLPPLEADVPGQNGLEDRRVSRCRRG